MYLLQQLNGLLAVGISHLWWCSFLHSGCKSLLLKELLKASSLVQGSRGAVHDFLTHHLHEVQPTVSWAS